MREEVKKIRHFFAGFFIVQKVSKIVDDSPLVFLSTSIRSKKQRRALESRT
jgi:hypothetical protein